MSKSKFISYVILINLFICNNICFSETRETKKWNTKSYIGINVNTQIGSTNENNKFDFMSIKTSYEFLLNKKRFNIGPKIFTLMDISNESNNFGFYRNKQSIESILFKNNKIGLGLSIGFDLLDNVTLTGTISGVKQFKRFSHLNYNNFGYDLEVSMKIALVKNINVQISFSRMSFSKNGNNQQIQPSFQKHKKRTDHIRKHHQPSGTLPKKVNIDSVSVGLSYKF